MTEAIYLEVSEKTEAAKKAGRRVSVSGMLKFLGVSRSGYLAWLHHIPSDTEKRREAVKAKIQDIYDDSKQNYGAPKITVELRKTGEVISEGSIPKFLFLRKKIAIRLHFLKSYSFAIDNIELLLVLIIRIILSTYIFFPSSYAFFIIST